MKRLNLKYLLGISSEMLSKQLDIGVYRSEEINMGVVRIQMTLPIRRPEHKSAGSVQRRH